MRNNAKGNSSGKKGSGNAVKKPFNKSKKDKNVFKVNDTKGKKKPKEVKGHLKKIKQAVTNKQEKVDANFKNLYKDMVVKQSPSAIKKQTIGKGKKAGIAGEKAKDVSQKLGKLKV